MVLRQESGRLYPHRALHRHGRCLCRLPARLGIRSFVNGEKRQDSNTALQIFDIDHVIAELSQGMTLKAGTIIATGTPAGVGMGMDRRSSSSPEMWCGARSMVLVR